MGITDRLRMRKPDVRTGLERLVIGSTMSVLAWILERALLRSAPRE